MSSTTSGPLKKIGSELQLFRWLNFLYYLVIWVINIPMHVDIDSTFADMSSSSCCTLKYYLHPRKNAILALVRVKLN